jgi:hypothetical protein
MYEFQAFTRNAYLKFNQINQLTSLARHVH